MKPSAMPTPPAVPKPTSVPRIGASDIMQGGREVIIQHGAAEYRLRITSTGKLILTK